MLIQRIFSKRYPFLPWKEFKEEYKTSLEGVDKLEKNKKKIIELGMKLTTSLLLTYMDHPLTIIPDKFANHIIKEGWFARKYRPVINGLDMQDLLLLDQDTGKLYMFDVERPSRLRKISSIKQYIEKVLKEVRNRAEESGYKREVGVFIKEYKKLCL